MGMDYITPGHVQAFQMVRSPHYGNITMSSCRVNGEPAVVIVMVEHVGEDKVAVMPLFVAITKGMDLELPGDRRRRWRRQGSGDGKAPVRPNEAFKANAETVTAPGYD
jgi:hypothetical protein